MPRQPTRGKRQLAIELPEELLHRFRVYVVERGERLGDVVARAIDREMRKSPACRKAVAR